MASRQPTSFLLAALLAAGCGPTDRIPPWVEEFCETTASEPEIGIEEPSSLGFSGREVLDSLQTAFEVTATSASGSHSSVLTFSFSDRGTARVTTQETRNADPIREAICISGPTLWIPVVLAVSSEDGWFSGAGTATVTAQGMEAGSSWVEATFGIEPSDELLDEVIRTNRDDCNVDVFFSQIRLGHTPWDTGPVGGINRATCSTTSSVYRWGNTDLPPTN